MKEKVGGGRCCWALSETTNIATQANRQIVPHRRDVVCVCGKDV